MADNRIQNIFYDVEEHLAEKYGFQVTRMSDRRMAHPSGMIDGRELRTVSKGSHIPLENEGQLGPLAIEMGYGMQTLRARILVGPELRWVGDVSVRDAQSVKDWLPTLDESIDAELLRLQKARRDWAEANPAVAKRLRQGGIVR